MAPMDLSKLKEGDAVVVELPDGQQISFKVTGRGPSGEWIVDGSPKYGRFVLEELLGQAPVPPPQPTVFKVPPAQLQSNPPPAVDAPTVPTDPPPPSSPPPIAKVTISQ